MKSLIKSFKLFKLNISFFLITNPLLFKLAYQIEKSEFLFVTNHLDFNISYNF